MTMRKLILVLMLAMMVGACGESSTDVATRRSGGGGGGDEFIPPDTVVKTEDARFDVYQPGNPAAIETVHSLTPRASFARALEVTETFGYGFDPARVAVATARLADGRDVVVALGSLTGGLRDDGHVLHVRIGDREETLPLRTDGGRGDGFEVLEIADKHEIGPQSLFWDLGHWIQCLMQATADIMACSQDCEECWRQCVLQALVKLVFCIHFTMI
jgi:hypothetical protein